jgi:serine/threonine protein kinase/WD40 repeat protein
MAFDPATVTTDDPGPSAVTLTLLRRWPLLTGEQLKGLEAHKGVGESLADELLRRGWLTAYQIKEVEAGRASALIFGPYTILDVLGEGGMGRVYKARHRALDRLTALKIVRPDRLAGPHAVARFAQEARSAANLKHPNLVTVYDAGEIDGVPFAALEYVAGTDLQRLVAESGPLLVSKACDFVRQAALGLQHAHEEGLIHRDIKPGNLMLAPGGVVKVLDFGLARFAHAGGDMTVTGQVVGTPAYIAPEQAENAKRADARSDIFSLGCTLFYLLTGRLPYRGEGGMEQLAARLQGDAISLRKLLPGAPAALTAVVARMLARDPDDRYQTPAEVAAALEPFSRSAQEPTVDYVPPRKKRLRPLPAVYAAIGVVLLFVVVLGIDYWGKQRHDPGQPAPVVDPPAGDGSQKLVDGDGTKGDPPVKKPKAVRPGEPVIIGDPNWRSFGPVTRLAVTFDGKRFSTASTVKTADGAYDLVTVRDGVTGEEITSTRLTEVGHEVQSLAFSRDGRFLAVSARSGGGKVYDLSHDNPWAEPASQFAGFYAGTLRFDGADLLAVQNAEASLWAIDAPKARSLPPRGAWKSTAVHPALSPDGRWLAYGNIFDGNAIFLRDLTRPDAKPRLAAPVKPMSTSALAASPDGRLVAIAEGNVPLRLYDLSADEPKELIGAKVDPNDDNTTRTLAFNGDGTRLALGSTDGTVQLWRTAEGQAKLLTTDLAHDNEVTAVAFAGNGTLFTAGGDHRVRRWRAGAKLEPDPDGSGWGPGGIVSGVAFTSDGKALVMTTRSDAPGLPRGSVEVRDPENGDMISGLKRMWTVTDLQLLRGGKLVAVGGRLCDGKRTAGKLAFSHWDRVEEWNAVKSAPLDDLGNTVRLAASDSGDLLVVLAVSPFPHPGSRVDFREIARGPDRVRSSFRVPGAKLVALSPDGQRFALACANSGASGQVDSVLVDAVARFAKLSEKDRQPEPLVALRGFKGKVTALAFRDADTLLTADTTGAVSRWAVVCAKNEQSRPSPDGRPPLALAVSDDGKRVAFGTDEGSVFVWDAGTLGDVAVWKLAGPVHSITFDAPGKRIAAGLANGTAVVLRLP